MKRIDNTLFVFSENVYLSLDGENVVISHNKTVLGRFPFHNLEGISVFSHATASANLMGACAERGINLTFFTPHGKFLADIRGKNNGNVLLKKAQYRISEDEAQSLEIAKNFITGKVFNSRWVLERTVRDHALRVDANSLKGASTHLASALTKIKNCTSMDELRGIEGDCANVYFSVFDNLILRDKEAFCFRGRNRRPPKDRVNAMLSLFYSVLANSCTSALLGVGLDPLVGFMHTDRPGRNSLALDLMEEMRPLFVDRFVVTCINNRIIDKNSFEKLETGEVHLAKEALKRVFNAWHTKNEEALVHPFTKEKMMRGFVIHMQARLLAKCVRDDIDVYPPFLWK